MIEFCVPRHAARKRTEGYFFWMTKTDFHRDEPDVEIGQKRAFFKGFTVY